ncbi:MAG: YdcH family protein [Sphingomonadaceae bacterium]|nr:YdcH family protein [Sphingomonadales bacterium]NCU11998.1 YdcH family protein [Sphingomonadaceae bacterium]
MSDRVFRLLERHQKLDEALRRLQAKRWPDPFEIARLKKLKLAIKDRLARLARRPARSRA